MDDRESLRGTALGEVRDDERQEMLGVVPGTELHIVKKVVCQLPRTWAEMLPHQINRSCTYPRCVLPKW